MNDCPAKFSGKVLIVDDDFFIRLLARETLGLAGFQVEDVDNGPAAIALLETFAPDIILLDVLMPGMDGYLTCQEICKHPLGANIPVLMMTGLNDFESIQRAYQIGATDFITKPIHWLVLPHRVQYIIRSSKTNKELKQSEARLSNAQTIARLGSWEWDIVSDKLFLDDKVFHILAIDPLVFNGTFHAFLNSIHPLDREVVNSAVETAITTKRPLSIDHQILLPNGTERFVSTEAEIQYDSSGRPCKMAGTVQDITDRKQADKKIRHLAFHDNLTGLPNRMLFNEKLEQTLSMAKRHKRKFALFFLDLDRFKVINDTLGHSIGDSFLKKVAERLQRFIRTSDYLAFDNDSSMVARFGGDEFTVLLEEIDSSQGASKVAQRVLEDMNMPFTLHGQEVRITTSIGISIFPDDGTDAATLIKNADSAMYHAKELGKNNFQFYDPALNANSRELLRLEFNLRKALEREEFTLLYQPQVNVQTGLIIGLEALIRWVNPELGTTPPAIFVPLAEEAGLITTIDKWVINTACKQIKSWRAEGLPPVKVAINLSGYDFSQASLVETVNEAISSNEISPNLLEFELTESIIMNNSMEMIKTFNTLKKMGFFLSIDDFGTGYSSLSHLKKFPTDTLKIDQSFIRDLHETDSASIVKAIIAMAHSLNMNVIAEGVETEQQMVFLMENGCWCIQGYLFSPPVTSASIAHMLMEQKKGRLLDFINTPLPADRLAQKIGSSLSLFKPDAAADEGKPVGYGKIEQVCFPVVHTDQPAKPSFITNIS